MFVHPPNEMLISCKRITYVPYRFQEAGLSGSSGRSAFVGCISGLDSGGRDRRPLGRRQLPGASHEHVDMRVPAVRAE
jgi:hypothetical protein